jgi:hypothetical protein
MRICTSNEEGVELGLSTMYNEFSYAEDEEVSLLRFCG